MKGMKLHIAVLLGLVLMADSGPLHSKSHPRIWLTPASLSALRAKAGSGDLDWLRVKADADQLLTRRMPRFTITAATNSSPVQFTIAETVTWSGSTPVFIGGASGAWAAVNAAGDRPTPVFATRVGDRDIEGCDFLHENSDGLIDEFVVMVRPLSGALALADAMRVHFKGAVPAP